MLVSKLNPKEVFYYFSKIASIPHGSGNTAALADYCMKLAKEYGHEVYKDTIGNVMIFAKGTKGYENSDPVILQAHLDMVCDKAPDCTLDMAEDGLELCTDGKYLWAEGTSLGGDDGIAVAYILTILTSDHIPHPPIEALLTIDEEVGMIGARNLDPTHLKGKRLINLDSLNEQSLRVSCAGAVRGRIHYSYKRQEEVDPETIFYSLSIDGLKGGHSGKDINKDRLNAIKILAEILAKLGEKFTFSIAAFDGGAKENAIPKYAKVVLNLDKDTLTSICEELDNVVEETKAKYNRNSNNFKIAFIPAPRKTAVTTFSQSMELVHFLMDLPSGVWKMSEDMPGVVESSMNLGTITTFFDSIQISYLVRSNVTDAKQEMKEAINQCVKKYSASVEYYADYAAWEYRKESPLRDTLAAIYEEQYGHAPVFESIHSSLECGILSAKIPDVDIISLGPSINHLHTSREILDVASVARVWNYLLKVLRTLH